MLSVHRPFKRQKIAAENGQEGPATVLELPELPRGKSTAAGPANGDETATPMAAVHEASADEPTAVGLQAGGNSKSRGLHSTALAPKFTNHHSPAASDTGTEPYLHSGQSGVIVATLMSGALHSPGDLKAMSCFHLDLTASTTPLQGLPLGNKEGVF